jgi:glycosyltransferase involved in cell wall biosynthesis
MTAIELYAVHVIAGLDPAQGGTSYSVPRLCEALAAAGVKATLLSVANGDEDRTTRSHQSYSDHRFTWDYAGVPILRELRSSAGLSRALAASAVNSDVVHGHGLWLMPNVHAGWAATRAQRPLIVSPRGMLAPVALAFSTWKKKTFWRLLQDPAIRRAACLHATSCAEYDEIRSFGLVTPVAIIPNGIDLPEPPTTAAAGSDDDRVVLSLGRIHPKKGLDRLLQAWSKVESGHHEWRLRIVGPGEKGHDKELRGLAARLGLTRVSIEGPVYGDAKFAAYREADFFVLPTLNENFGLTVAEALASGTPAISTRGAPWNGLKTHGCGWWIDHGVEPLAAALANAMTMPRDALATMGMKGRNWMMRDYSWDRVGRDMLEVYRWLAHGGQPPSIRFD